MIMMNAMTAEGVWATESKGFPIKEGWFKENSEQGGGKGKSAHPR